MLIFRGRTRREAVRSLLAHRQDVLSCVSQVPVVLKQASPLLELQLGPGGRITIGPPGQRYHVRIQEQLAIGQTTAGAEVSRLRYRYEVYSPALEELVSYHLHPFGMSTFEGPHLHLPTGVIGDPSLANKHLPTGTVELEDFVRFLIAELGARPLRSDWDDVLRG